MEENNCIWGENGRQILFVAKILSTHYWVWRCWNSWKIFPGTIGGNLGVKLTRRVTIVLGCLPRRQTWVIFLRLHANCGTDVCVFSARISREECSPRAWTQFRCLRGKLVMLLQLNEAQKDRQMDSWHSRPNSAESSFCNWW